ncbi:MAG: GNAT family N-acetyltransferase [Chitinophagaceae bacterium]|nr:GNAT family N-acetyltransferase [Chitinophagaceae bacterium]
MPIKWVTKNFETLSVFELYQILRLRSEIFVVEQNCVYQDLDNKDSKAIHLFGEYDGKIIAYLRLFKAGDYFDFSSIGRVVVDLNYRDKNFGHELIDQGIAEIRNHFNEQKIAISAQLYLKKFYETHGFIQTSEMYLEDNIPHIQMKLTFKPL